eukprot:gnl/TRDRNA2_/TRDRNA2_80158_c0_seq1.p1 gnl/TRDRNA2_/TRDRNA2_80158_c0~~gnl/TRDRNA2_/TRDRNA2_80158_c0_seq1.p1  ORF type:complete len:431 (+),score=78.94 gnl/TRDRNA2_/TRDRNA2_80158_c0_seq1:2-1294(+)
MTNAHCVAFATHVQVKRRDQDIRFKAEVVCIGFECDLALLVVKQDAFWRGLEGHVIEFSRGFPSAGNTVTVLGYGAGGDNICTTQGVVSRMDVQPYPGYKGNSLNFIQLPVIQIDAAINPGNSGGPAICCGKAIGVAFMGMDDAQNVGFIIPAMVALHFLEDFRLHGSFTHFGYPPFKFQSLDTEDMRRYYDAEGRGGVRVTAVDPNVDTGLRVDDVVVKLFGVPVGHDGKVAMSFGEGESERVSLWFLFCDKFTGTDCEVHVRRRSQDLVMTFPLQPFRPIVPTDPMTANEYLIVAGLVLQPLTTAYLSDAKAWHSFEVQKAFATMWEQQVLDRQVVVVTDVLSHEVNTGIMFQREDVLVKVNGEAVRSLRHVAELVDNCQAEWLVLEFSSRVVLTARTESARSATKEVLLSHDMRSDRFLQTAAMAKL